MITIFFVCILKAISRKFAKKLDKDFAEESRDVQQSCDTFESIIAVFQNAEVLTEREGGKFFPFSKKTIQCAMKFCPCIVFLAINVTLFLL